MAADPAKTAAALSADRAVGVVGAGAMGSGIAQVAVLAGHKVLLFDARPGTAQAAVEKTSATIDSLLTKGRVAPVQATRARENLRATDSLGQMSGCALVIEAITEDLESKRALFRSLEGVVGSTAVLATNTSSISITAIGSALEVPDRLVGMHFFNPAPLMPLVEVIGGVATSKESLDTIRATAERWGKVPVLARSTPGFIVNRVARPYYAEALRALSERASDCVTIDAVMREAAGFRMGPFELMDLIGHDVNYAVTKTVFDGYYGDRRFTPSLLQLELVEAGYLGRKSGRGFYDYTSDAAKPTPSEAPVGATPTDLIVFSDQPLGAALTHRLNASHTPHIVKNASPEGRIAQSSSFVLYASDGRTATARARSSGEAGVLLVDYALDYGQTKRLAVAAAHQAQADALPALVAVLREAAFSVSAIADVPGMLALRTWAMLANEAADAVNQTVCTPRDCDIAMQTGVNYPIGPLAWADRTGIGEVVKTLDHLCEAYGEERYRVSPLLRRKAQSSQRFFGPEIASYV